MAEALQLGLDVIATAYCGNTGFSTGTLAHPERCVWGEPDVEPAAVLMQHVEVRRLAIAADPEAAVADPSRDPSVLAAYRQHFVFAAAGLRYRARLEELHGDN